MPNRRRRFSFSLATLASARDSSAFSHSLVTRHLSLVTVFEMPELPEVETVLRGLRARVLGRRVAAVEVRNPLVIHGGPDEFVVGVTGRRIEAFVRKGKALAIELGPRNRKAGSDAAGCFLVVRLGMTGQPVVVSSDAAL